MVYTYSPPPNGYIGSDPAAWEPGATLIKDEG